MSIVIPILITLHVVVSVLMVFVVLMQRPRSEGLGAAFGGGMTENIFGAQTTNVLAKFTTYLGGAFFVLTLLLAIAYAKSSLGLTQIQRDLMKAPAPVPTAESAAPAAVESAKPEAPVEPAAPATPAATEAPAATEPEVAAPSAPVEGGGEVPAPPAAAETN
jgi:preprotein translocase subunit SecG